MAYRRRRADGTFLARVGAIIVGCTAILTLTFFGLLALLTGTASDIGGRLPFYVLGMAAVFVSAIIILEQHREDGRLILTVATITAVTGGLVFVLGGEGILYASRHPDQALASRQFLYLIAAGLIATGVGFWGLNHWRDALELRF